MIRPLALVPVALGLAAALLAGEPAAPPASPIASRDAGCLSCHKGIEPSHPPAKGAPACADCHRGRPEAAFEGDAASYLRERRNLRGDAPVRARLRDWLDRFDAIREREEAAARLPEGVDVDLLETIRYFLDSDLEAARPFLRLRSAAVRISHRTRGGPGTPEERQTATREMEAAVAQDVPGTTLKSFLAAACAQDRRRFFEPIRTGALPDLRAKVEEGVDANILAFQRMFLEAQRDRGKAFEAFGAALSQWEARFAAGRPGVIERRRAAAELQRALETDDPRYALRGKNGRFQPLPADDLPLAGMRARAEREEKEWLDRWARVLIPEPAFQDALRRAHDGLVTHPADFPQARETCGACHKEIAARMFLSTHATGAGIVASVRHAAGIVPKGPAAFGAQPEALSGGGVRLDPFPPKGDARRNLLTYEGRTLDYVGKECASCHLWASTRMRGGGRTISLETTARGGHRLSGCAACHVPVAPSGGHRGGDPTLPPDESDEAYAGLERVLRIRPERHSIVRRAPSSSCLACHRCPWSVGPGFEGLVEREEGGARAPGPERRFGEFWEVSVPGVHRERGMGCTDCHAGSGIHGGGRIEPRAGAETAVRCVSCHATPGRAPQPSAGIVLERRHGTWFLKPGGGGRARRISEASRAVPAHRVAAHFERLECIACHAAGARWGEPPPPVLRLFGTDPDRPTPISSPEDSRAQWNFLDGESTPWRWLQPPRVRLSGFPPLGWNARGRLSPVIQAPKAPPEGLPSPGTAPAPSPPAGWMPFASHAVRREGRSCATCHADAAAFLRGDAPASHVPGARGLSPDEVRKVLSIDWRKGPP